MKKPKINAGVRQCRKAALLTGFRAGSVVFAGLALMACFRGAGTIPKPQAGKTELSARQKGRCRQPPPYRQNSVLKDSGSFPSPVFVFHSPAHNHESTCGFSGHEWVWKILSFTNVRHWNRTPLRNFCTAEKNFHGNLQCFLPERGVRLWHVAGFRG